jgi:transcriptional regulator with XRE-family HTH domain
MSLNQLRTLLEARGLTEVEVAAAIGVHKNTVSNWATGRTPVVPARVQALATLLGTTIDEVAGHQPRTVSAAGDDRAVGATDASERLALDVLARLLDSAGALRALHQSSPNLMGVLRDAQDLVERFGDGPQPLGRP